MEKITVSIVGISGYTGLELMRILRKHPQVQLKHLVARENFEMSFLAFQEYIKYDIPLTKVACESDVVFLALPHTIAQKAVAEIYGQVKIIDLSGDFRLQKTSVYRDYYGVEHSYPQYISHFVYGLPEMYKEKICGANYIANPGCFALVCQLLLLPLYQAIHKADIFALTGSTGSGKTPSKATHHPIRNHNITSYNICRHRHMPEIMQILGLQTSQLSFVPTSGPFSRGIFANAFIQLCKDLGDLQKMYCDYYQQHPYVRICDKVELAHVIGSNFCHISCHAENERIVVQGCIDNLVKGAAGNAVQNMNLMFGLEQTCGLDLDTFYP